MSVELSAGGVSADDVLAVARLDATASLTPEARAAMERSASVVAALSDAEEPAYGVSTGFGSLATVRIAPERHAELQRALIRSHATGMGPPVEREVVRAMMLLRARSLAMGWSGARPVVAETILALLNGGLTPVVPEYGSLGASGDLAPLAHCALTLIGEGSLSGPDGAVRAAAVALAGTGVEPITLGPKEGLALINGTDGMLGMLVMACADLDALLKIADVAAAMSVEALLGTDRAFAAELVALRPQPGQAVSAANLRALLADSEIVASHRFGSSTRGACATRSCDRRSTTRWSSPTAASNPAATFTGLRSRWLATSSRSRRRRSGRSPSAGPTGCSTRHARMGCRRSSPRIPVSTPV